MWKKLFAMERQIYFVMQLLQTNYYDDHFHAYAISFLPQMNVLIKQSLKDPVPLRHHNIEYEGHIQMFASVRHMMY